MSPNRRIFWMLASAFMALFASEINSIASVLWILATMIWISHNAMVLTVRGRTE